MSSRRDEATLEVLINGGLERRKITILRAQHRTYIFGDINLNAILNAFNYQLAILIIL